jgi:hypothetical protein
MQHCVLSLLVLELRPLVDCVAQRADVCYCTAQHEQTTVCSPTPLVLPGVTRLHTA